MKIGFRSELFQKVLDFLNSFQNKRAFMDTPDYNCSRLRARYVKFPRIRVQKNTMGASLTTKRCDEESNQGSVADDWPTGSDCNICNQANLCSERPVLSLYGRSKYRFCSDSDCRLSNLV